MKEISINGSIRNAIGKKASKTVRAEGMVPCCLYGEKRGENGLPVATHFVVSEKEINKVYYSPNIYLVNINLDGVNKTAVVKEVQPQNIPLVLVTVSGSVNEDGMNSLLAEVISYLNIIGWDDEVMNDYDYEEDRECDK